ncbi:hypothetical protein COOONC_25659 [Cooperia oncophora]
MRCFSVTSRGKHESNESSLCSTVITTRKVTHSGTSTGSLFLRFGCVVFGVIGVVYYSFLVFLCVVDSKLLSIHNSSRYLRYRLHFYPDAFHFLQLEESPSATAPLPYSPVLTVTFATLSYPSPDIIR